MHTEKKTCKPVLETCILGWRWSGSWKQIKVAITLQDDKDKEREAINAYV